VQWWGRLEKRQGRWVQSIFVDFLWPDGVSFFFDPVCAPKFRSHVLYLTKVTVTGTPTNRVAKDVH
jgi:hypothetical protein